MSDLSILIKTPNQRYEDVKVDCNLSWTIFELKSYLSNEYPSKPKTTEQRLIYSGHLLRDEQTLNDIIQPTGDNNLFTIHLVVAQSAHTGIQEESSKSATSSPSAPSPPPATTNQIPNPPGLDGFPPFSPNYLNNLNNLSAGNLGPNNAAVNDAYNALMNQYYQYISYYHLSSPPILDYASYSAFANAYLQAFNQSASVNPTTTATSQNGTQLRQRTNGPNDNQPAPPAPPPPAAAAAVPQVDQQDQLNRDWAEWMLFISKSLFVFSLIYLYSSVTRLILFLTLCAIVYFSKNVLNAFQNPANNNNNNNQAPNREALIPSNNNNNPTEDEPQDMNEEEEEEEDNSINHNGDNIYSALRFIWLFVSSLFTSLVPDTVAIN